MYVFSFFRELAPALHLAISTDMHKWTELNKQEPVLWSKVGAKYWRDPFIIKGKDGLFHLLCTDGWESRDIIHATSTNLVDWNHQDVIPVMEGYPTARNAWAPEACLDERSGNYFIFWSSTVDAAFPGDKGKPDDYKNHRIYGSTTSDFKRFSPSKPFFDPGYNCIDASISYHDGTYLMAFKDERGENSYKPSELARKHVLVARARSIDGPWEVGRQPISRTRIVDGEGNQKETWAEGPCVLFDKVSREWWVFFEYFRSHRYGGARSKDGITWQDVGDILHFPPHAKHGTIFEVHDRAVIEALEGINLPYDE